jgi:hypothetical protein
MKELMPRYLPKHLLAAAAKNLGTTRSYICTAVVPDKKP